MKKPKLNLLLFLITFMAGSNIKAQEPLSLLTIQQSVDLALKNNSEINQLRAQLKGKEQNWRTMTGITAPELSFTKEGINKNQPLPFNEQRFTISQSVDFPITTYYRLKSVDQERQSLSYQVNALERDVKSIVKANYIEIMYAFQLQKLRVRQVQLSKEIFNAVLLKNEPGLNNGIDLTYAELQMADAQNDLDDSKRNFHNARYALFQVIGLEPEMQKYDITFSDSLQCTDIEIEQIEMLAVLDNQPAYIAALHEYNAAKNHVKEAQSNILPDMRFNYYKQDYGNGYRFNGFEIGLTIPLWLPLEQKGEKMMALARQEEIGYKQKAIELEMKKQIETAWHNYEASRATINLYKQTIRAKAEQLQLQSEEAYKKGEIDLHMRLNSEQVYLNIQQRYYLALRDFYLQLIQLEKFLDQNLVF